MSIFSTTFFLLSTSSLALGEEPTAQDVRENDQDIAEVEGSPEEGIVSYIVEYENPFQYQQWNTQLGKKVFLVEDHRVPIVEVQIAIPAGVWHKIDQELHLEELAAELLKPT